LIINPRRATLGCSRLAGFSRDEIIEIQRLIEPQILKLNEQGFLNGHTPFSAMLAIVTLLISAGTKLKHIALSNESSANEATIKSSSVNHQYSKSIEFERDFRHYVNQYISVDFNYFSFLRPLSELTIAKLFANKPKYFSVFESCNVGSKTDIWCCKCSKCLFTFIILSPFIQPNQLEKIFGENLLDKQILQTEYQQLIGLKDNKPFECVGTQNEVKLALKMALTHYPDRHPYLLENFNNTELFKESLTITQQDFTGENFLTIDFERLLKCNIY